MAKNRKSTTYLTTNKLLVSFLMKQGYMYFKVDVDKRNPSRNVWIFESSPELREYVDMFYENRKMYQKYTECNEQRGEQI